MKNEIKEDLKTIKNDLKNGNYKRQLANLLTASRLLSPFILIPLICCDKILIAVIMVIIFALTDTLDGYFARKYNSVSTFGKYLDAIVDKIFVLSLLIPIIIKSNLNLNNYSLIFVNIFLEIVIAIINLYAISHNVKTYSTIFGKIKTIFLFSLVGLLYLNKLIVVKDIYIFILIITTIIMQILAIISYYKIIKGRKVTVSS